MKNGSNLILILICLLAVFSSCTQHGTNNKKVLTDSLIRANENIAVGSANFGISEKEFNHLFPDSLVELGANKYILTAYFDSAEQLNKVYMIDKSTLDNQKFDDKLFAKLDLIKQYFINIYGLPNKDKGYPIREKMLNGNEFEACIWEVGRKKISVGIAFEKTDQGNFYYVLSYVERKGIVNH